MQQITAQQEEALLKIVASYKGRTMIFGATIIKIRVRGILAGWSDRAVLQWHDDTHGTSLMKLVYWNKYR